MTNASFWTKDRNVMVAGPCISHIMIDAADRTASCWIYTKIWANLAGCRLGLPSCSLANAMHSPMSRPDATAVQHHRRTSYLLTSPFFMALS
eukprot:scaffold40569_cov37-Prasinocladus_malaysianus.AAC.1